MKPGMNRIPKTQNPYAATEKRRYFRFNALKAACPFLCFFEAFIPCPIVKST
jgi:hypothetical protein